MEILEVEILGVEVLEVEVLEVEVLEAMPLNDDILIRHFLAIQESNGAPRGAMRRDAEARALDFIREGREQRRMGAFLAVAGGEVAGSAACELRRAFYPDVFDPAHRLVGYVWSVYVARWRRQGVARLLMERTLTHLRELGCTAAVLHASNVGKPLYAGLGFRQWREMRLDL